MLLRIGLGAAGGLLVGIIAAILVGILDKRLRGREPAEAASGSLVIGGLPVDASRPKVDVVDLSVDSLYAERLRELRTNLRFVSPANGDTPPKQIAVTSPSAGDGRTTTAIDLAAVLAETGKSVVLVDGDLRNPAVADRLPLNGPMREGAATRGLSTVLVGESTPSSSRSFRDIAVGHRSIAVLPAGPSAPRPGELWANDRAGRLFDELANSFDYVIVDTPPLDTYTDGAVVAALGDGALLLARIRSTTSAAVKRAVQTLRAANVPLIGTVVTFERGQRRGTRSGSQPAEDTDSNAKGAPAKSRAARPAGDADADTTVVNGLGKSARPASGPQSRHGVS